MNGHPSWELLDVLSNIRHRLGGLETGQAMTLDEVRTGLNRVHERIDDLHIYGNQEIDGLRDRVTTLEASKSESFLDRLGLSLKEAVGLLAMAVMDLAGTLQPEHIAAWLGH